MQSKDGKRTEYNVGVEIRQTYGDFLGNVYTPDLVDARSSDYNRTKMSLQLALAALFPPAEKEQWEPSLSWQPIPYSYAPNDKEPVDISKKLLKRLIFLAVY